MARRHKRKRLGWLGLALVVAAVLLYQRFGDQLRAYAGLDTGRPPAKAGQLRIVSWNLNNFPKPDQDLPRLRERLLALEPDLVAVQEVKDPAPLRALMPEWTLLVSEQGGAGHQRVGFFYDPNRIELLGEPTEHRELTMKGRVRPAFHAYVRQLPGGPDFHAVVVHLKARPDGLALRREQWTILADLVRDLAADDEDVVLLGDFNPTGAKGGDPEAELNDLDGVLREAGLRRLPNDAGCSAYWDGRRRDAWQEPSLLDLVWIRALAEATGPQTGVSSLGHCARHHCEAFRSTDAYPELDYEDISDHCPVVVDLRAGADDDP